MHLELSCFIAFISLREKQLIVLDKLSIKAASLYLQEKEMEEYYL